jgi:hypothetical protein
MTLERSYIGYLGFLVIDFLKSVLMYSKGAICLSRLLFKMGLFTGCIRAAQLGFLGSEIGFSALYTPNRK